MVCSSMPYQSILVGHFPEKCAIKSMPSWYMIKSFCERLYSRQCRYVQFSISHLNRINQLY